MGRFRESESYQDSREEELVKEFFIVRRIAGIIDFSKLDQTKQERSLAILDFAWPFLEIWLNRF